MILPADTIASDFLGYSVSLNQDGTYVVIGAYFDTTTVNQQGSVYIYTRSGTTWSQQQKLTAYDAVVNGDCFGYSVDVNSDGTYLVAGSYQNDSTTTNQGAGYIYVRSGSTWSLSGKVAASDPVLGAYLGFSASINSAGNYVVLGAYNISSGAGAAYVFFRATTTWAQQAKLVASDAASGDQLGVCVAISNDGLYVIAGAQSKASAAGAAYIFLRTGTSWSQQQKITASDASSNSYFGSGVTINGAGDTVVVGAPGKSANIGAAYIYTRSGVTWSQQGIITGNTGTNGQFGTSVDIALTSPYIISGAPLETVSSLASCGAAYIFA